METYSLGVALFDYLPVAATAAALWALRRGIAARHAALATIALVPALLIPFGGFCKATWKTLIALEIGRYAWLDAMLFLAMAPGFAAMAYCMHAAGKAWRSGTVPAQASWSLPALLSLSALPLVAALLVKISQPESRAWFFVLLGFTTLGSAALAIISGMLARWSGLGWGVVACFIYSPVAGLILGGLSRLPPGESTAWIQETVNLSAQLALAIGAFSLSKRMQAVSTPTN